MSPLAIELFGFQNYILNFLNLLNYFATSICV